MEHYYNFTTISEKVPGQIDSIITTLFPSAKREAGCYRVGGLDGEKGRSLKIATNPGNCGLWHDHGGSESGNIFSLVAQAKGISYQDAGEWLAKFLNVPPEERFFRRKPRAVPTIDRTGMGAVKEGSRAAKYAESRGISLETLALFRIACTDQDICFPHFDDQNRLVLLKHWSTDDQKRIFTNKDPVHCLFGKESIDPVKTGGKLVICEGQWDAMTWRQAGYPAVSIPSGAKNDEWITEDWIWLNQFTDIFLDFDDDEEGRAAEERVKIRLGYERCRCIRYKHKDANEVIKVLGWEDGKAVLENAYKEASEAPIEHIVDAETLRNKVKDRLTRTNHDFGTPFFLRSLPIRFRPHEMSLWFGYTSHGKSTALDNQIAFQAGQGVRTMVASFEANTVTTYSDLLVQYTANDAIGGSEHFDEAYSRLKEMVVMFDSQKRTSPDELIATMTLAHRQLGICSFVIDNVMTLDVDRQDNTSQAETCDKVRIFVARYPVHVHMVAHPRKPPEQFVKPPALAEVRGASEWGDMAFNAICVYRDMNKAEKIATMWDENIPRAEIEAYRMSCPDGRFMVRKQRENGELPVCGVMFEKSIKRYWRNQEDLAPYFVPANDTQELQPADSNEPL